MTPLESPTSPSSLFNSLHNYITKHILKIYHHLVLDYQHQPKSKIQCILVPVHNQTFGYDLDWSVLQHQSIKFTPDEEGDAPRYSKHGFSFEFTIIRSKNASSDDSTDCEFTIPFKFFHTQINVHGQQQVMSMLSGTISSESVEYSAGFSQTAIYRRRVPLYDGHLYAFHNTNELSVLPWTVHSDFSRLLKAFRKHAFPQRATPVAKQRRTISQRRTIIRQRGSFTHELIYQLALKKPDSTVQFTPDNERILVHNSCWGSTYIIENRFAKLSGLYDILPQVCVCRDDEDGQNGWSDVLLDHLLCSHSMEGFHADCSYVSTLHGNDSKNLLDLGATLQDCKVVGFYLLPSSYHP
jgi:hypothetical protein